MFVAIYQVTTTSRIVWTLRLCVHLSICAYLHLKQLLLVREVS